MFDTDKMSQMLDAYDVPAILVTADYEIIASNDVYRDKFGDIDLSRKPKCFAVSHGYSKPCDQAGEDCPLLAAKQSRHKEKVLHIHQTPNGREHVDVEMVPIFDDSGKLSFFVELLRPVPLASGKLSKQTMVGSSLAFEAMLASAARVAGTEASVLLLGETGTGKELVAQMIHLSSKRQQKSMVTLECAGLSESLIESELFGHKKGAFTGADANKIGLVEHADGGTLFLDEIGDVSLTTQVKLLRLIESKTFRRVGSTEVRTSDFRLICATHRNLKQMVEQGLFRLDLYYRLNVFPIRVPSLSGRRSDIPSLVEHLLRQEKAKLSVSSAAMRMLQAHNYQGNIRELRNIISRAIVICDSDQINSAIIEACIAFDYQEELPDQSVSSATTTLESVEWQYFTELIIKHGGDKNAAAKEAGISLRTLYRKLKGAS